jgi:carboxymethylenebutenolidase
MTRYDVRSEPVYYSVNGELVGACLYRPQLANPQPALVVIQEWWGLNNQIKGVAERFAHVGYVSLAVDLYHGEMADTPEAAQALAHQLTPERAEADLRAAVRWLRAQSFVKDKIVGSVGFCLGGRYALLLATGDEHVQAAVSFYGRTEPIMARIAEVRAPILGLYGAEDTSIPVALVEQLCDALTTANKPNEFVVYPKAGHAFFNEQRPSFRPDEAEDAWSRANKFFYRHLGEPQ